MDSEMNQLQQVTQNANQGGEDGAVEAENKNSGPKNETPPSPHWSVQEDTDLIYGWLFYSSNAKTVLEFPSWHDVAILAALKSPIERFSRNNRECKERWATISNSVGKFISAMTEARRRATSGMSDRDVVALANELYQDDAKSVFSLAHAYDRLHAAPLFLRTLPVEKKKQDKGNFHLDAKDPSSVGSFKRPRLNEKSDSTPANSGDHSASVEGEERSKQSTESLKGLVSKNLRALSEANRMVGEWKGVKLREIQSKVEIEKWRIEAQREKLAWEREKLQGKDRLHGLKVLNLLVSKESLSPVEEALKKKLCKELFQI